MQIDVNRLAFAIAGIVCMVLVAMGKIPAASFAAFAPWLLPSPLKSSTQDLGQ